MAAPALNSRAIVPSSQVMSGLVIGPDGIPKYVSGRTLSTQAPSEQEVFQMQIARFNEYIEHVTNRDQVDWTAEEKRQHFQEKTPIHKFREAMYEIFGSEIKTEHIKQLYRRISANPDTDVDWSEVFGYGSGNDDTKLPEAEEAKDDDADVDDGKVFVTKLRRRVADASGGGSKKRDIVKQIVYIPQVDNYVFASQNGFVQVVSAGKYSPVSSISVQSGDLLTMGCIFLPNLRRLAIASDRQLCIWDYRSPTKELFKITPFPANILCLAEVNADDDSNFEDTLLFGDVEGCVGIVKIHQKDLSVKTRNKRSTGDKKDSIVHFVDIGCLNTPIVRKKVHDDWVARVFYCPDMKWFSSCSGSSKTSFIGDDINSLMDDTPYPSYAAVDRGCSCFVYSDPLNLFVTGGSDKIVRIWHPGIYTKPAGKLVGHIFSIVDVQVNEVDQHIISLSSARLIRVWDIHTLTALQVFGDNENRPGERRIHCMLFDNNNEVLLTGSSVVDEWPLARKYHATILTPQTHAYSLMLMALNAPLGQMLTADSSPQIRVWDVESGKLQAQINKPHGHSVEVVVAAFDPTGFRMATGGMNGSIRLWDFGSTQIIKSYNAAKPGDDKCILDLKFYDNCPVANLNYLIGLGWGGKVKVFRDASNELALVALCDFSEPDFQGTDMLFTPLIDNPAEARKAYQAKIEEEERLRDAGYQPHKHKKDEQVEQENGKQPIPLRRESRSLTTILTDKPADSKELLRYGFNRTLLSLNSRSFVTGTSFGHIVQWDLRTMEMDLRWKLPPSNFNDQISGPGDESTANKDIALWGNEELLPSHISKSSTGIHVAPYERHRVNAMLLIQPALPEQKKRPESENGGSDLSGEELERVLGQADDAANGIKKGNAVLYERMLVLVTGHQDSWIRFWTTGRPGSTTGLTRLLQKVQMEISDVASPVTCLCSDPDNTLLAAGDFKGYVCVWATSLQAEAGLKTKISQHLGVGAKTGIGRMLGSAAPTFTLTFRVSWHAHKLKVENIVYYQHQDILLTASMDSSVRIWKGFTPKYLGFYGQPQPFGHTGTYDGPLTEPAVPDIDDKPLYPKASEKELEEKREQRKLRDLPLIVDRSRWERGPSAKDPAKRRLWRPKFVTDKYFNLLVKPKLSGHGEGAMAAGGAPAGPSNRRLTDKTGGVYRSLITYRVTNTDHVTPRSIDFSALEDKSDFRNKKRQQPTL